MTLSRKLMFVPVLVAALLASGCHKDEPDTVDAAAENGNMAPDTGGAAPAQTEQRSPAQYQRPEYQEPQGQQYNDQAYDQGYDRGSDQASDVGYQEQVSQYAPEPPPSLPEYEQPPCPQPNYIWTPGYWSYAPTGYYWVPGVWAAPPYTGALWTPGYWGWVSNRYGWHQGYWGRYIGYYGGVNYGHGYVGRGYWGGYWKQNQFVYNRKVTNINTTIIHNTYIRNVTNITTYNRVSYSGGRGGVNLQPIRAEVIALRQPRLPPLAVQQQHRVAAMNNRAQSVAVNHGEPKPGAIAKPLAEERREPTVTQVKQRPPEPRPVERPVERPEAHPHPQPARPAARTAPRPEPHEPPR